MWKKIVRKKVPKNAYITGWYENQGFYYTCSRLCEVVKMGREKKNAIRFDDEASFALKGGNFFTLLFSPRTFFFEASEKKFCLHLIASFLRSAE